MNFISTAITMSIVVSILLLFRQFILSRYSAKVMCILWLVIAIRMLIPVQIELPVRLSGSVGLNNEVMKIFRIDQKKLDTEYLYATGPGSYYYERYKEKRTQSVSLEDFLICIWITGAVCSAISVFASYYVMRKSLKNTRIFLKEEHGYSIYLVDELPEPISFGILKPAVYLPMNSICDNLWIVNHEITHCIHKDGLMQLIMSAVKIVYWFHPLIYVMDRMWEKDREMYCDDAVTNGSTQQEKVEYMHVLVDAAKVLVEKRNRFASGLLDGENHLKERIIRLSSSKIKKAGKIITIVLSSLMIVCSFMLVLSERTLFAQIPDALNHNLNEVNCDGMIQVDFDVSPGWMGVNASIELTEEDYFFYVEKYDVYTIMTSKEQAEQEFSRVKSQYQKYRSNYSELFKNMEAVPIDAEEFSQGNTEQTYRIMISGKDMIGIYILHDGKMAVTTQNVMADREFDEYSIVEYYQIDMDSVDKIKDLLLEIEFWYYSEDGPLWRIASRNSWYENHGKFLEAVR